MTALYQAHALGLMRLAHIMLGDRPSAEEIAATMGIGPSSVRSAAHRALASLGRMLEESS